jgi:hypothetical protein
MAGAHHVMRRVSLVLVVAFACGVLAAPASAGVPPPVDAREQCKHDGWQLLGRDGVTTFRNQGECVSFAALGNTPVPAPAILVFKVFGDPHCTATFLAYGFPIGTYDVTLVSAGGVPQSMSPVDIAGDGQAILVYSYLPAPNVSSSVTVSNATLSVTVEFRHTC